MRRRARAVAEFFIERTLFLCAAGSILVTVGIILVLVFETATFLREVPITEFLFGTEWTPLFYDRHFGILPLVGGTLLASSMHLADSAGR
jgi:phosphate transport system permease protein